MNFVRKKKRGQNQKVRKYWFSEENYRIIWRREIFGIRVPAAFQPAVRIVLPDGHEMWDFCGKRLCKTRKAAEEVCERHCRLWQRACEATGIRAIREIFGREPFGVPVWARNKLDRKVLALLMTVPTARKKCDSTSAGDEPDPSDPTSLSETSPSNITGSDSPTSGPASLATAEDGSTTRKTRRARSKATETDEPSDAKPAKASATGRKKPAAKPTGKPSKRGAKKKPSTKRSSKPAAKPSKGSRKSKSKRSGS